MRRHFRQGVALVCATLGLGMAAAAGWYFGGRSQEKGSLTETPATAPARLEMELPSVREAETPLPGPVPTETPDIVKAIPQKAETAETSVQSASEPVMSNDRAATGAAPAAGSGAEEGRNEEEDLLDLVNRESRLVTTRLSRENSALKLEAEDLRERNRKLSVALAAAQAALDQNEERRARLEGTAADPIPDVPLETHIVDVNPELGMVVLDAGDRQGMRYGLVLSVLRDRQRVARIRVVDVRERIAGAIVEETMRGEVPQTGDRAVLTRPDGSRGK